LGEKKEPAAAVDGMETGKLSTAAFELSGMGWAEFVLLGQALVNRTEENCCNFFFRNSQVLRA
jgi:hypothetical protein